MDYEVSSGNVFEDLGVKDPEIMQLKSELVYQIQVICEKRGYTQKEIAKLFNSGQPSISRLFAGNLRGFTVDALLKYLIKLGYEFQIKIKVKGKK